MKSASDEEKVPVSTTVDNNVSQSCWLKSLRSPGEPSFAGVVDTAVCSESGVSARRGLPTFFCLPAVQSRLSRVHREHLGSLLWRRWHLAFCFLQPSQETRLCEGCIDVTPMPRICCGQDNREMWNIGEVYNQKEVHVGHPGSGRWEVNIVIPSRGLRRVGAIY